MKVVYRCTDLEDGDQYVLMSGMMKDYQPSCVDHLAYLGEV